MSLALACASTQALDWGNVRHRTSSVLTCKPSAGLWPSSRLTQKKPAMTNITSLALRNGSTVVFSLCILKIYHIGVDSHFTAVLLMVVLVIVILVFVELLQISVILRSPPASSTFTQTNFGFWSHKIGFCRSVHGSDEIKIGPILDFDYSEFWFP